MLKLPTEEEGGGGDIERVCINGVSVLSGLNLKKMWGLSFGRDKANCL